MRKKESEHDDEEEETNKPLTLIYRGKKPNRIACFECSMAFSTMNGWCARQFNRIINLLG